MKSKGFTLIELVVVIVILGILAVTAAPKFLNLQDDAHNAVLKGYVGAFKSGIDIAHARWAIDGNSKAANDLRGYNGLDTNKLGYPIGTDKQPVAEREKMGSIGPKNIACVGIWDAVMNEKGAVYAKGDEQTEKASFVAYRQNSGEEEGDVNYDQCHYDYVKTEFDVASQTGSRKLIYSSITGSVTLE